MTVPDRSTLPAEYLDFLAWQAENVTCYYGRKPILPAPETPEELVQAAKTFERILDQHLAQGAEAAKALDFYCRKYINQTLNRQITKPTEVYTHGLSETDLRARDDLSGAFVDFADLIAGTDHSDSGSMNIVRTATVSQRKIKAEELGLELELTDDEWWQL